MTSLQKFTLFFVPTKYKEQIIDESKHWMMTCTCGHKSSVWDAGGVRGKAKGSPKIKTKCPQCGKFEWHSLEYEP